MRRIAGAALAALGGLLLAVAVGLPLFVAPAVSKLPYDLQPCRPPTTEGCLKPSVAEAIDAQVLVFREGGVVEVTRANLRTTVEVVPEIALTATEQEAGKLDGNAVIWSVYQTVVIKGTNELVSASSTQLALDRTTGEAAAWDGQWIDDKDTKITYTDLTYKFPFGTEQHDYKIYDTDVRMSSTAKFESVQEVDGLETYHFVQQIPETKLAVPEDTLAFLSSKFTPKAESAELFYRNTREVWVDPVTGVFIKVRERPLQILKGDDGSAQILLNADFNYTPETIANSAQSAKENGSLLNLVTLWVPIGAGVLGLALAVIGVLLLRESRPPAEVETGPWDDTTLVGPRHGMAYDEEPTPPRW